MDFLTVAIIIGWYAVGLAGSFVAVSGAIFINWEEDRIFLLFMALFGPLNLGGATLFGLINGKWFN
jgi:hypothetical protein